MTLIQKLISLLPKPWYEALRADSERWRLTCRVCGTERSVWEAGGVRYNAASSGKVVGVYCPTCRTVRLMTLAKPTTTAG